MARPKLVQMKPKQLDIVYKYPAPPGPITQVDLAEVVELRRQKHAIEKALREKKFLIRFGLEHGAPVEPGARSVYLGKKMVVA